MEGATQDLPAFQLSLDRPNGDEPLVDVAYTALRDAICDGRLQANQRLPQIPLAEHLGISRTPVRDALQRLAQEGLVRAVSFRGFVVSEFSAREVLDVYQVRLALEPFAVSEAFPNFSHMDLAAMRDICDQADATDTKDVKRLYDLNSAFHLKLTEPGPNEVLVRMLSQLWQLPSSLRLFHAQANLTSAMKASGEEHRGIIEAIEADDRDLTIERITEHIRGAEEDTLDALEVAGRPAPRG